MLDTQVGSLLKTNATAAAIINGIVKQGVPSAQRANRSRPAARPITIVDQAVFDGVTDRRILERYAVSP